jgi:signal transduction histidine kinase
MLVFLALGGGVGYLVDKYRHADRLAAVGGTTARIVHDMKNPIASIQAASDLLREDLPKEQREEFVDIISESVQRFLNMTGELLEFSRGGAQRLNYSLSNMEAFLEETAKTLRPLFQQRDLQLVVRVEGAIEAELDSERIRRVVNNIAQNALEVLPPGGGLKIECSAVNDKILLKFVDDGPGMPPHVKSRILEAFFSYGKAGGTGLGLAIAKDIIAQHDGSIRVESAVGKGTTFFVALPRTPRRSPTASRKNTKPTSQTESTEKPLLLA